MSSSSTKTKSLLSKRIISPFFSGVSVKLPLIVKILPNTTCELRDENGNTIKNILKLNSENKNLKDLADKYKTLSNDIKKFVKSSTETLCNLYVSNERIKVDLWKKDYAYNPILCNIVCGLVWIDENDVLFTVNNQKIIKVTGEEYTPEISIRVAQTTKMNEETIENWRNYFITHSISQPFEQVWEPIIDISKFDINERYINLNISKNERKALKKALISKGINVYSDKLQSEYNAYTRTYTFSSNNTMHFGEYISIDYTINQDESIVFNKITINKKETQALNSIIFVLEKVLISLIIQNDNVSALMEQSLTEYTLAQIMLFINLAQKHNSINCLSFLLDYKNKVYSDVDFSNEFVLDLL